MGNSARKFKEVIPSVILEDTTNENPEDESAETADVPETYSFS